MKNIRKHQKEYQKEHQKEHPRNYKFFSLDYVINNYKLRAERLSKLNKIKGYGIHYNFDIEEIKRIYNNINENKRKILP